MATTDPNALDFATRKELIDELTKRHEAIVVITTAAHRDGGNQQSFEMTTWGGTVRALGLLQAGMLSCQLRLSREVMVQEPEDSEKSP